MSARVIFVHSDLDFFEECSERLEEEGYLCDRFRTAEEATSFAKAENVELVISDLDLENGDAFKLMEEVHQHELQTKIVVCAEPSDPRTVTAIQRGVSELVSKPVDPSSCVEAVTRLIGGGSTQTERNHIDAGNAIEVFADDRLRESAAPNSLATDPRIWRRRHAPNFIGNAPKLMQVFELLGNIADTDCSVLIVGQSGTGKELVARALHNASDRSTKPFITVNCAAIPENLLESELFGHTKGAFTGATHARMGHFVAANHGTMFLDEIGELPISLQAKLLRVLQEREVTPVGDHRSQKIDVRIICATNRNLEEMVRNGQFREDLYYRINIIPVNLPALRERRNDIPLLVENFVKKTNSLRNRRVSGVSDEAIEILRNADWPGNVRQLENTIERVVILRGQGIIRVEDLPPQFLNCINEAKAKSMMGPVLPDGGLDLRDAVERFESSLIVQALERAHGNKNRAASILKMNRTTLVEKIKKKGLTDFNLTNAAALS